MKTLTTLFKKQIFEYIASFKREKGNKNLLGFFMFLILAALAAAVLVPIISMFMDKYLEVRINNVLNVKARQYEITTLIYSIMFFASLVSSVARLQHLLFEDDDRLLYATLPIHPVAIFISKVSFVYLREMLICVLATMPIIILFAIKAKLTLYYVLASLFVGMVLPIVSTSVASLLCIPTYYIKKLFHSKYTVMFIISTIVVGLLFYGYMKILNFASLMVSTGEMRFFFSEKVMGIIDAYTKHAYPANYCANIVLKTYVWKNLAKLVAIVLFFSALGILVVSISYPKAVQLKLSTIHHKKRKPKLWRIRNPYINLLEKEFVNVLRTPSYALEYFAVAVVAPLMVYCCMDIGKDLLSSLIFVEKNFELSLFIILAFTSLTNTFAATSISRDGQSFYTIKTLPVSYNHIVGAKVLFSSIVMFIAVTASIIVIAAHKYVTVSEALYVYFIALSIGFAQICFAIKRDLKHPKFPKDSSNEVIQTNTTVSSIILVGLLASLIIGGFPLANAVLSVLAGRSSNVFTYVFPLVFAILLLGLALGYLHKGLDKTIQSVGGGK